ncbi:DUF6476 family protein [Acidocella sp.]|uniref:DUF6476 family protein n=1 Tax=Acidocella sp. TaxID=50710 RepID=UPI002F42E56C
MRDQPQGDLRGLKALVGILGVLIVIGTAVVIGTVIHRLYARSDAPSMAPLAVPAAPALPAGVVAPSLAPGEHIAGIAAAGGRIAVWVSGPHGDRLLLIDPASGQTSVLLRTAP